MTLTVPEHPGAKDQPLNSPDGEASNIGFLNRVSPQAVREYLEGRSEEPNPPMGEPCPRAAECPSWCGRLQETGEFPFPLTHDGRHESCRYWQFLEKHKGLRPAQRSIFAQAAIDAELDTKKKRRPKQASAAQASPKAREKPQASPKAQEKPQEKPQETQQAGPVLKEWARRFRCGDGGRAPLLGKFHIGDPGRKNNNACRRNDNV